MSYRGKHLPFGTAGERVGNVEFVLIERTTLGSMLYSKTWEVLRHEHDDRETISSKPQAT
jgi:hypothetical protein